MASTVVSTVALTSGAPNGTLSAVEAFFANKKNVSLCLIIPLVSLLYISACVAYGVSRCRRKRARAAKRRTALSRGELESREFTNADSTLHGSQSSLKSLLGKDRNRVNPIRTSVEHGMKQPESDKKRAGHTLDFVSAGSMLSGIKEHPSASATKLTVSPGGRELTEGQGRRPTSKFVDPSILDVIKEEPAPPRTSASDVAARSQRRSSAPNEQRAVSTLRTSAGFQRATPLYNGAPGRCVRQIPLEEHVEEALQNLKVNSNVDTPTGKDLRNAMKTVITLEMEVKTDPKAQELIAKYRESKQKTRQTTVNQSLKNGEWQKVPISEWIALKRAAGEYDSRPTSVTTSISSRY